MLSPHQYRVTAQHCPSSSTILLKITVPAPAGDNCVLGLDIQRQSCCSEESRGQTVSQRLICVQLELNILIRPDVFILKLRPLKF